MGPNQAGAPTSNNADADEFRSWGSPASKNADAEFRPANGLIGAALSATSPSVNMLIDDVGWYYHSSLDRWPYELNMSMCLSADALSSSANNALVNWGNPRASDVWASDPVDNYGTPGSANLTCE